MCERERESVRGIEACGGCGHRGLLLGAHCRLLAVPDKGCYHSVLCDALGTYERDVMT